MTSNLSIYNRKVRTSDQVLKGLIYLAAAAAISLLVGIMGYVFIRGLPQLSWQFLSTVQSARKGTFGILGNIVNTLYIIVITLIIAAPVGIGSSMQSRAGWCGRLNLQLRFYQESLPSYSACSEWCFSALR